MDRFDAIFFALVTALFGMFIWGMSISYYNGAAANYEGRVICMEALGETICKDKGDINNE